MTEIPKEIEIHNGTYERCDIIDGPCACGSWHSKTDIKKMIKEKLPDKFHEAWKLIK